MLKWFSLLHLELQQRDYLVDFFIYEAYTNVIAFKYWLLC